MAWSNWITGNDPVLRKADGINEGNTWWDMAKYREPFYNKLNTLTNSDEFKALAGSASIRVLTTTDRDTLVSKAKSDLATSSPYAT